MRIPRNYEKSFAYLEKANFIKNKEINYNLSLMKNLLKIYKII